MSLDPTRFTVDARGLPTAHAEEEFSQIMWSHLQRAPWLALSILAHALALFLVYLVLDEPRTEDAAIAVTIQQDQPEDPIQTEPVPEELVKPEDTLDADLLDVVTEPLVDVPEYVSDLPPTDSPMKDPGYASPIGIGGIPPGGIRGRIERSKDAPRPTQRAIVDGLEWLKDHQDEDGRWDSDGFMKHDPSNSPTDDAGLPTHDVGVTGLAVLAFLGNGNTMRSGPYQDVVKRGVTWLHEQQNTNGLFGTANSSDYIYDHAIAAYAVCEAYGLSNNRGLRRTAQRGINYLESHRNPYSVWRYQPRDGDNDLSVTGWCVMAYKSAQDFGLEVNPKALEYVEVYLDELTDPNTGHTGYQLLGQPSSRQIGDHSTRFPPEKGEAMTAVGLFCRFFLGQDPAENKVMERAADTILAKPAVWKEDGSIDHYYWYYATYALYQMGGKRWWGHWSDLLDPAIVQTQRGDGNFAGSWDAAGAWGEDGGRVYSTAMCVLTLEAFYRYTRLVR